MANEQEQRERAETFFAAYNRRDWDAFFADLDDECERAPAEENVAYRGREEMTAYFERWLDAWVEFRVELEQLELSADGR